MKNYKTIRIILALIIILVFYQTATAKYDGVGWIITDKIKLGETNIVNSRKNNG
ncbi:MAG: hypothetical protein ACE5KT_12790 [Methanosarcinales archaeon]